MAMRAISESDRVLDEVAAAMPHVERVEVNLALMRVIRLDFEHGALPDVSELVRLVAEDLIRNADLDRDINRAVNEWLMVEQLSS